MKPNFENADLATGRPNKEFEGLPIAVTSELQRIAVLGVVAVATVLSIGMGPGMMLPTSGQSRIQHRLAN